MVESALITVSDVDQGENQLQAASGNTAHGSYAVTTSGWTFTADNSTLQSLGAGDSASDSFTITSDDGTDSKTVVRSEERRVGKESSSGTIAGDVTEDSGDMVESALIMVCDDEPAYDLLESLEFSRALFSSAVTTSGWTFTADNSTLQSLGAGDSASDSFTITSDDGTDSKTVV